MANAKNLVFFLLIVSLSLFACKGSKELATSYGDQKIKISKGGGFTGEYEYFQLNPDGKVMLLDDAGNQMGSVGELSPERVKELFQEVNKLAGSLKPFERPGNLTNSISLEGAEETRNYSWAEGAKDVPEELSTLFNGLWEEIQGIKHQN